jgi:hypothetical protein
MGFIEYSIILIVIILPLAALFDLMSDKSDKWMANNKAVWAVIIILLPFLGPVLYLVTSRFRFLLKR